MIMMTERIIIRLKDPEKNFCSVDRWYMVVGTATKTYSKNGQKETGDMFIIINDRDVPTFVFPSRCIVRVCNVGAKASEK